jgi:cell division protein FtsN
MSAQKKQQKPKRDKFWVIVAVGVVVVSIIAYFLANFLAGYVVARRAQAPDGVQVENQLSTDEASRADRIKTVQERTPDVIIESNHEKNSEDSKTTTEETTDSQTDESASTSVDVQSDSKAKQKTQDEDLLAADQAHTGETDNNKTPPDTSNGGDSKTLYRVQLDVFDSKDNALALKSQIEAEYGITAHVSPVVTADGTKYRVQAGVFSDRTNAEKLARELQLKGHRTYISKDTVKP